MPASTTPPLPTIAEAARLMHRRALSPVELMAACLARIEQLDGRINSFVAVRAEGALADARRLEAGITRGEAPGPLAGIPFAIKDVIDVAGLPTTGHSNILTGNVPDRDATCVRRLREAGAIVLGKLACHEFATGGPSFDLPWPPARNPWNVDHYTGGSSSGAAAAVAAGLCPLALGTDTGGSIRSPAAYCGVTGLKPTIGRISSDGLIPLAPTFDQIGPMCRSAEDCALALQAMVERGRDDLRMRLDGGAKGLRIGVIRRWYEDDMRASDEAIAAMAAALAVLRDAGAVIEEVALSPLDDFAACFRIITLAEAFAYHRSMLARRLEDFGEVFRYRVLPGLLVQGADYLAALGCQQDLRREVERALERCDVLVTATVPKSAPRLDQVPLSTNFSVSQLTAPFSVSQSPVLSLGIGFGAAQLPLGMQIAGRPFEEATVLRLAHAFQQATSWHTRDPIEAAPLAETSVREPDSETLSTPAADLLPLVAANARWAGLDLGDRQLAHLASAAPYIRSMVQRIRGRA